MQAAVGGGVAGRLLRPGLAALCVLTLLAAATHAQQLEARPAQRVIGAIVLDERTPQELEKDRKANTEKYSGGAALKTNPELEELLRRATLFAEEGSYRNATLLWQKVLTDSGDALITRDGETYYSLTTEVEATIAQLPPDGLRQYRITADGEARAALASATNEEEGLRRVVREFFLSSFGDEAAYQLGCLALDRYDFLTAQRMFRKVLESYPDPTVPVPEVWLRLAVATARVGDREAAAAAFAEAQQAAGITDDRLQRVARDIETAPNQLLASSASDPRRWPARYGGPTRKGAMPALPESVMSSDLASIWNYSYTVDSLIEADVRNSRRSRNRSNRVANLSVDRLVDSWRKHAWQPAGRLLVAEDQVIFKTKNDLVSWRLGQSADEPAWRSLWLNAYKQDDASQMLQQMRQAYGTSGGKDEPSSSVEVLLFGDAIHQAMSIAGDMVLTIEGERYSRYGGRPTKEADSGNRRRFQWGTVPRRTRTNWLTAYDLHSGKLLWRTAARAMLEDELLEAELPAETDAAGEDGQPQAEEVDSGEGELGFMAAPIPYGRLLLVPVSDGGAIWIHALDADRGGEVVWASYLCDEPSGGTAIWSPVGMALEGRDLYVLCGTGVIFSLDAATGEVRFARRYIRDGKPREEMQRFGNNNTALDLIGWQEDMIIPYGRVLVVMASDHDELFAVDRQSGDTVWRAPRSPFDDEARYGMGVVDNKLYCGGPRTAICYDLAGEGRLAWARRLEDNSYGRGMVTRDGVYLPVGESIVKLDLQTGQPLERVGVRLTSNAPVGNLYSDGQRLWTIAMNEVHALGNLEQQLALLSRSIEQGDVEARLDRASLLVKTARVEEGFADLDLYYRQRRQEESATAATAELMEAMSGMQLFEERPERSLQLLNRYGATRTEALTADDVALDREVLAEQLYPLEQAIRGLGENPTEPQLELLLAFIQRVPLPALHQPLGQVIEANIQRTPQQPLRQMVASDDAEMTRFGLELLMQAQADDLAELAGEQLTTDDPLIKFTAARALCTARSQKGLETLVELLGAEPVKVRAMAWQSLMAVTGKNLAFDPLAEPAVREQQIARWRSWLSEAGGEVNYQLPLPPPRARFGRLVVSSQNTGEIIEYNSEREVVWRKRIPNVQAVQGLPNGNLLLAYYSQRKVAEIDREGNEVWQKSQLPGVPTSVQRLENGNTLVVCSQPNGEILEFDRAGEIVWRATPGRVPICARRLSNGNTLVSIMGDNRVVELNRQGDEVWSVDNLRSAHGVRRLENGDTLIALAYQSTAVQVNTAGNRVWGESGEGQWFNVERLPNGKTVVATSQGVIELDEDGKQVWRSEFRNICKGLHAY